MNTENVDEKYLTVRLNDELYAMPVVAVREIVRFSKVTPIPQMPSHVLGVINLRGKVIPIVDLRVRFALPAAVVERTCVVVVHTVRESGGCTTMGLVVDGVEEVGLIPAKDIEPPPSWSGTVSSQFMAGIARVKGSVKMLLDVKRLISPAAIEMAAVAA